MPMRIPSNIDADSSSIATLLSKADPIASSLSPTTQGDILGILQREQDHAISLLSLSPLLSSLFVSYANRVAALESASATPSPESEEWKSLQDGVTALQEENEKLRLENLEMARKLEAVGASQEAFHSQVSSLKETNTVQQGEIKSLRAEFAEVKDMYDRLVEDSNAEKAAHQIQISDLESQRVELKETVVDQQVKILKLERQLLDDIPPVIPTRQPPSPSWPRGSPTFSPAISRSPISRLQTPLPEGGEPTPDSHTSRGNKPPPSPVPNVKAKLRTIPRGQPPVSKPGGGEPRPMPQKQAASVSGWLKSINDGF